MDFQIRGKISGKLINVILKTDYNNTENFTIMDIIEVNQDGNQFYLPLKKDKISLGQLKTFCTSNRLELVKLDENKTILVSNNIATNSSWRNKVAQNGTDFGPFNCAISYYEKIGYEVFIDGVSVYSQAGVPSADPTSILFDEFNTILTGGEELLDALFEVENAFELYFFFDDSYNLQSFIDNFVPADNLQQFGIEVSDLDTFSSTEGRVIDLNGTFEATNIVQLDMNISTEADIDFSRLTLTNGCISFKNLGASGAFKKVLIPITPLKEVSILKLDPQVETIDLSPLENDTILNRLHISGAGIRDNFIFPDFTTLTGLLILELRETELTQFYLNLDIQDLHQVNSFSLRDNRFSATELSRLLIEFDTLFPVEPAGRSIFLRLLRQKIFNGSSWVNKVYVRADLTTAGQAAYDSLIAKGISVTSI